MPEGVNDELLAKLREGINEGTRDGVPDPVVVGLAEVGGTVEDELDGSKDTLGAMEGKIEGEIEGTVELFGMAEVSTSLNVTSIGVPSSGKTVGTALIEISIPLPTEAVKNSSAMKLEDSFRPLKENGGKKSVR